MSITEKTETGRISGNSFISRVFLNHPASVNESFGTHFLFALGFSAKLFQAAAAALVHAIIPCLFEKTASTIIRNLVNRMDNRG